MNVCAWISQVSTCTYYENILTFCAAAACPTFLPRQTFFFEAEHSCSRNSDLEGAKFCVQEESQFSRHVLVVVLWWLLHGFGCFFLSRFEEGVLQHQKLEILERSLPKTSTTQQVWQPADFFRVDSQDLHFYHFWPSDPFCCRDFITLHVLGTKSQKVRGVRELHKKTWLSWSEDDTRVG